MFGNGADGRAGIELVKRANLGGILIGDVLHAQRALERCSRSILAVAKCSNKRGISADGEHALNIALAVDGMVPFVGGGGIESTACITHIRADEVAERTVSAEENPICWVTAGRIVVAGAIGFAGSDIVADPGAVLPRRVHKVKLPAPHIRRLIPDRMGGAQAKLNAVIAAGIAHHDLVIAPHAGEWIERRRRGLVWGVLFADLDGADCGISQANVAVAAEEGAVDLIAEVAVRLFVAGKRGNVESRFEL